MIAVVIPYYQREPGVLARALRSVAAQEDCGRRVGVFVVDDSSPVPAAGEVASAALPFSTSVRTIFQANGGPGAARNRALNELPADTELVAFLDSDDRWDPAHLRRACAALDAAGDVFFGEHLQLGQTVGAFVRGGRLDISRHRPLGEAGGPLHAYQGDMIDQVLTGNLIGTSTVVYRWAPLREVRFKPSFRTAGEDYLFWMDLARAGARFVFSTALEATYEKGVNVYAGSGWGTEQHAERVFHELRYRKLALQAYARTDGQRAWLANKAWELRRAFAEDLLHRLAHGKRVLRPVLWQQLRHDPLSLPAIGRAVARKLGRRRT